VGGEELVREINHALCNSFHIACRYNNASIDVVTLLLEVGGETLTTFSILHAMEQ